MVRLSIVTLALLVSFGASAEVCEGLTACTNLYTQLTGKKVKGDNYITPEMSLAVSSTTMESKNATNEFKSFLNKNAINLTSSGQILASRHGEFLTSPIYVVSPGNMPMMINKDGLVTMVYQAKKPTAKLITSKIRRLLSKKKTKSVNSIVEFKDTGIITASDTYEHASQIMTEIMKSDTL